MLFVETYLGFSTADADDVEIRYSKGDLSVSFRDWIERQQVIVFRDCLAFQWEEFDEGPLRDDICYEVRDSAWLARQAELHGVSADQFVHLKLCYNGHGVLDVLAAREGKPIA